MQFSRLLLINDRYQSLHTPDYCFHNIILCNRVAHWTGHLTQVKWEWTVVALFKRDKVIKFHGCDRHSVTVCLRFCSEPSKRFRTYIPMCGRTALIFQITSTHNGVLRLQCILFHFASASAFAFMILVGSLCLCRFFLFRLVLHLFCWHLLVGRCHCCCSCFASIFERHVYYFGRWTAVCSTCHRSHRNDVCV